MTELLQFLENNPAFTGLVAVVIVVGFVFFTARLFAPVFINNAKSGESQSENIGDLVSALNGERADRRELLTALVNEQKQTNEYLKHQSTQNLDFIGKLEANFERWFTVVGEGFQGAMQEHNTLALDRFGILQGQLQAIATRQTTLEVDIKSGMNIIAERLYLIQQKLDNNPTEPFTPIKATATIAAVVVEEKQPNEP